MQSYQIHTFVSCLVIVFAAFLSAPVWSITNLDAELYSSTEYSSNAELSSFNYNEDVIQRVGVNLLLREERKRFNADASLNLEQEMYLNNTYSDETRLTTGFGLFNFDIVEDFLDWRTSFTRSEVISDATAGDTPDNREQRNVFRTGPTVTYRINSSSTLISAANFVQVENSSETASDTKRLNADVSYLYQLNSVTQFNLSSVYDAVLESESESTDPAEDDKLKNLRVNFGMQRQFLKGVFSFNIGRSQVKSDTTDTIEGNYFSLIFNRSEVFWHDLSLNYQESISDSSIGFDSLVTLVNNSSDGLQTLSELAGSLDVIKRKTLSFSATRNFDRYRYTLSTFWGSDDYEIQLNDEESLGVSVQLDHQVREGFNAGMFIQYEENKFIDSPTFGTNRTNSYGIDSNYRVTEALSVNANIGFEKRRNEKNTIREYEEFVLGLGLTLKLL
ncbi:MAG: hypothetical protein ACMZ64_01475 [Oleiphilus sp.]